MTLTELFAALEGEKPKRKAHNNHHEDDLQMACVRWFDLQYPEISPLLYHTANEGKVSKVQAGIRKRMGVRAGVADLILQIPRKGCSYLALELKVGHNKQSEAQKRWEELCTRNNGMYVVIRSIEDFITAINNYLS